MRRGTQADPDQFMRTLNEAYGLGLVEAVFEVDRVQALGSSMADQYWMGRRHGAALLSQSMPCEGTGET